MLERTPRALVGRQRELTELELAVADAASGTGRVCFVSGEPGIGKSRLAEEVARMAQNRSVMPVWGRCWEAGGAPAYWPWIQALRALLRRQERSSLENVLGAFMPVLAQLLPELAPRVESTLTTDEAELEQARFRLFEAVATVLVTAGDQTPILLLLEDVHAADCSSLLMLEFVVRQTKGSRVCILGTLRDAELDQTERVAPLVRVVSESQVLPLRRLSRQEVAASLEAILGAIPVAETVDAIHAASEGNPLFVREMACWLATRHGRDSIDARKVVVPKSLRSTLEKRLADLAPKTLRVLEAAAVLGREFGMSALGAVSRIDARALGSALDEARRAAIVVEIEPQTYRFSHMLYHDVLHARLDDAPRQALHERVADALEVTAKPGEVPWSEIAHHLFRAGDTAIERAIAAALRAGQHEIDALAFDDAVESYSRALAALDDAGLSSDAERVDVLLGLGRAQMLTGEHALARRTCERAAALARRLGDGVRLARAALEYGGAFVYGAVDEKLIGLLEEAMAALGSEETAESARVMARLAAARQPAPDPGEPIELAQRAIGVARRVGDEDTLLATLRAAGSAMMDFADPADRIAINKEQAALGERLRRPVDVLRANMRLAFDHYELGAVSAASDAIDECAAIAETLAHPAYQWQVAGMQAMRAIRSGQFHLAEDYAAEAHRLARAAKDPNAPRALAMQKAYTRELEGRFDELLGLLPELARVLDDVEFGRWFCHLYTSSVFARMGQVEQARARLTADITEGAFRANDHSLLAALAEVAIATTDAELCGRLYERLLARQHRLMSWGLMGLTWSEPVAVVLGRLATCIERWSEAEAFFEFAATVAETTGGRPHAAWVRFHHAQLLLLRDPTSARAGELVAAARREADALGMSGLAERCAELNVKASSLPFEPARGPVPAPIDSRHFTLEQCDEIWLLRGDNLELRLKDSKGVRILARLLAEPGRDVHVLELESRGDRGLVDAGDAGEILDRRAREGYKARLLELRAEIEQAEQWSDLGRAERARRELEMLTRQLANAVGFAGRARRSGAAVERARVNIHRRIRDAVQRITALDERVGRTLDRSVRTGTFCRYDPP